MSSSKLAELIERLERTVAKRGTKAVLARALGVSPARVSHWLHGASAPNAEDALRLLEWVANAEQQLKKEAGRASTRPARMTRKATPRSNEKAKSDRPKG